MQMLGWLYMPSVCAYQSLMPRAIVASFLNNVESKTYIVVFQTGLGLTREPNPNPNPKEGATGLVPTTNKQPMASPYNHPLAYIVMSITPHS